MAASFFRRWPESSRPWAAPTEAIRAPWRLLGVKCPHDLPLPPPAAHAPRRILAPAGARVRADRRRPDLPGFRARARRPRGGAVDAGRRAPVGGRAAAR